MNISVAYTSPTDLIPKCRTDGEAYANYGRPRAWSTNSQQRRPNRDQWPAGKENDVTTTLGREEIDADSTRYPAWVYEYKLRWPNPVSGKFTSPIPYTHSPEHAIAVRNALSDFNLAVYLIQTQRLWHAKKCQMLQEIISATVPTMYALGLVCLTMGIESLELTCNSDDNTSYSSIMVPDNVCLATCYGI